MHEERLLQIGLPIQNKFCNLLVHGCVKLILSGLKKTLQYVCARWKELSIGIFDTYTLPQKSYFVCLLAMLLWMLMIWPADQTVPKPEKGPRNTPETYDCICFSNLESRLFMSRSSVKEEDGITWLRAKILVSFPSATILYYQQMIGTWQALTISAFRLLINLHASNGDRL